MKQLDMFDAGAAVEERTKWRPTEEQRFGTMDAQCGLPIENYYSSRIFGERRQCYVDAYRKEIVRLNALVQSVPDTDKSS